MASPQKKKTTSKPRANRQTPKHTENLRSELRQDLWAIALFAIGVFIALCLWWTPTGGDRHMLGAVGFYVNQAAQWLFGQGKWFIAAALILLGASGWLKTVQPGAVLYVAYGILTASCCAIAHLRLPDEEQLLSFVMQDIGGGVIGGALVQGSNLLIGKTGSWILYVSLVAASVLLITGKTMRELASQAGGTAKTIGSTAGRGLKKISDKVGEMRPEKEPSVIDSLNLPIETALRQDIQNAAQGRNGAHGSRDGVRSENGGDALQGRDIAYHDYDDRAWSGALDAADGADGAAGAGSGAGIQPYDGLRLVVNSEENNGRRARNRKSAEKAASEEGEGEFQPQAPAATSYRLPSRNLLQAASKSASGQQSKAIAENVRILEKTLDDFGVKAVVTQVNRGPSITRFELQPAAG
ncbi:MAG: DNA translocase FtsK 4TM domain-containing protein, partial [Clostridiales bacterium]|nr:DNA translocase FtsK 4TM domain-containing protein [Clostridiales bacterium]